MCIIILKEDKDSEVSQATLIASSIKNPHGLGILWLDTWQTETYNSEEYAVLYVNRPYVAHFRYATVGKISPENCHPFNISENKLLFQNGTVDNLGDESKVDAECLAEILNYLPKSRYADVLEMTECRYVVADTKEKSLELFNEHLWTEQDGVLYSKENVLDHSLVGVYGTLKEGYSNNLGHLGTSYLVGKGSTFDRYPLIVQGLPYLMSKKGAGEYVDIDVYLVDEPTLARLDRLEAHPSWYKREVITILLGEDSFIDAWVYFNDTIEDTGIHLQSYKEEIYEDKYPAYDDFRYSNVGCNCVNPEPMKDEYEGGMFCMSCFEYLEDKAISI